MMFDSRQSFDDESIKIEEYGVSLIFLSYNNANYLEDKIGFLLKELSLFKHYELIIIDDQSTDGSQDVLTKLETNDHIKIILKENQRGIPHSMNLGVSRAKYEHLVFCDQRQSLSKNIIKLLVAPLLNKKVGAVSSCISHRDNENRFSFMRAHENFIKSQEARSGNLIGVYGPLYAAKKTLYSVIPEHIVLDDLFLSLKILKSNQICFLNSCEIFEKDPNTLYNYKRSKRYLFGLLQLISEKSLIGDLNSKQKVMLFWHKYLRLFIPLLLFISYFGIGIKSFESTEYLIAFSVISLILLTSIFPKSLKVRFRFQNFIHVNALYVIAYADLFFVDFFFKKFNFGSDKHR